MYETLTADYSGSPQRPPRTPTLVPVAEAVSSLPVLQGRLMSKSDLRCSPFVFRSGSSCGRKNDVRVKPERVRACFPKHVEAALSGSES